MINKKVLEWEKTHTIVAGVRPGMSGMATNWDRLAPNESNLGLFKVIFSIFWLCKHFNIRHSLTDILTKHTLTTPFHAIIHNIHFICTHNSQEII